MKESGMNEKEAMHMMIMTQCLVLPHGLFLSLPFPTSKVPRLLLMWWRYLDTLRDFAGSHGSIVVPSCDGPFKTSKNPISSQKPKPQTPHPPKKKKKKKKKSSVPAGASSDSANCGISDPAAGQAAPNSRTLRCRVEGPSPNIYIYIYIYIYIFLYIYIDIQFRVLGLGLKPKPLPLDPTPNLKPNPSTQSR